MKQLHVRCISLHEDRDLTFGQVYAVIYSLPSGYLFVKTDRGEEKGFALKHFEVYVLAESADSVAGLPRTMLPYESGEFSFSTASILPHHLNRKRFAA